MKAVAFHGVGDIRLDDVPEPAIEKPRDGVARLTAAAICGTDLHFVRGTMPGTKEGRILGHEGVGVVEEVGEHGDEEFEQAIEQLVPERAPERPFMKAAAAMTRERSVGSRGSA